MRESQSDTANAKQRAIAASLPRRHPLFSIVLALEITSDRQLSVHRKYRGEKNERNDARDALPLSLARILSTRGMPASLEMI